MCVGYKRESADLRANSRKSSASVRENPSPKSIPRMSNHQLMCQWTYRTITTRSRISFCQSSGKNFTLSLMFRMCYLWFFSGRQVGESAAAAQDKPERKPAGASRIGADPSRALNRSTLKRLLNFQLLHLWTWHTATLARAGTAKRRRRRRSRSGSRTRARRTSARRAARMARGGPSSRTGTISPACTILSALRRLRTVRERWRFRLNRLSFTSNRFIYK